MPSRTRTGRVGDNDDVELNVQPMMPAAGTDSAFAQASQSNDGAEKPKENDREDRLRVNVSTIDSGLPYGEDEANASVVDGQSRVPGKAVSAEDAPELSGSEASPPHYSRKPRCVLALQRCLNHVVPYGGVLSSAFNLASATLGAGIISTPSAFNLSGVVMSVIYLVLVLIGTIFSMNLIARVYELTGLRTFSQCGRVIVAPGVDYFLAVLLVILCFGGSVSYVKATSTLLTPVLDRDGVPSFLRRKEGNRLITSMIWLVIMLPLSIPKNINSLRYVSTVGVFFVIYFVFCMVAHSATHGLKDPAVRKQMKMVRTGNAALEGLSVLIFALLSQINAFEIAHEMRPFSVARFTRATTIAMVSCAVLYFLAGFFGYADFGSRVTDSVLSLYDPVDEPYIAVGYVGMLVKICVAFALHMIPFRDAVYHFLHWKADNVPYWRHALVMVALATLALICGLFVPAINTVFGLMGSFCGGILGMIMPAIFYMYCGNFTLRTVGFLMYFGTYLLLIGGVVAVVFGTATTIYSTASSSFT